MRIEWDEYKAGQNLRKHRLSFAEASSLFSSGAEYCEIFDEDHSISEDRFICIGPIRSGMIVVVITEPGEDHMRILSARFATRREVRLYRRYMEG